MTVGKLLEALKKYGGGTQVIVKDLDNYNPLFGQIKSIQYTDAISGRCTLYIEVEFSIVPEEESNDL